MSNNKHLLHKKSCVVTNGIPKLPTNSDIEYGEIAINYADGYETISVKNTADKISSFSSDAVLKKYTDTQVESLSGKVVSNEKVVTRTFFEVQESCGLDSNLKYITNENDKILSAATSLNNADVQLSSAVQGLDEKVSKIDVSTYATNNYVNQTASGLSSYTDSQISGVNTELNKKATTATTLGGYGITDAYTKTEADAYHTIFAITENIVTVTTDSTKGTLPYSTSYGYTNITVNPDAGIRWVEGGLYIFVVDTKMVVGSTYRNVRVRIGENDAWRPVMGSSSILAGHTYFTKSYNTTFQYKTVHQSGGALHLQTDNNTTYAYLNNTIPASSVTIDSSGFGAKYSLLFPTTPLSNSNGIVTDERWSSLVKSSSSGTTKTVVTPASGKFYIDRHPRYLPSGFTAGSLITATTYQDYAALDIRYTYNTTNSYLTASKKVFLYLKNFNSSDYSFEADATQGNIMTLDKIGTRFPTSTTGDVYLYFLGWTDTTWYKLIPNFNQIVRIYKYTPSTKEFTILSNNSSTKLQWD